MKLRFNIFKIFILAIIISIFIPLTSNAANIKLALDEFRGKDSDDNYIAYGFKQQHIYKIYELNNGAKDYNKSIFCLDAGRGFGTSTGEGLQLNKEVNYDISLNMFNINDTATIKTNETSNNSSNFSNEDYDKILRILKNTYISGTMSKDDYLKKMINGYSSSEYYITEKDIETAEQLAIWHYTNENDTTGSTTFKDLLGNENIQELFVSIYSNEQKTSISDVINEVKNSQSVSQNSLSQSTDLKKLAQHEYYSLSDLEKKYKALHNYDEMYDTQYVKSKFNGMWNRFDGITKLYKKFLEIAEDTSINIQDSSTKALEMDSNNAQIERDKAKKIYIAGPFKIKKNNDNYYDLDIKVTDENGGNISNYTVLDSQKASVSKTLTNLVGQEFYIQLPINTSVKKVKISFTAKYDVTAINYWTIASSVSNTQPVAIVDKTVNSLSGEKEVQMPEPEKTSKSVQKVWVDNENQDNIRPTNIKVQLYADGKKSGDEIELSNANNWSYTWSNLLKDNYGTDINYTVTEVGEVTGYTNSTKVEGDKTIITNTHTPDVTEKSVEKLWEDNNNQDSLRPTNIKVQLYANDDIYGEQVELNQANNWKYTWSNLPKNNSGTQINYTVREVGEITGYTSSTKVNENKTIIINTHETANIAKEVEKIWIDNNNQDNIRPDSIKVQLYADGEKSGDEVELNEENGWKYVWENLPKKADGEDIEYTIEEVGEVAGYTKQSTVVGSKTTITNTHEADIVKKEVEKLWEDNNDQDNIRPDSIKVQLYADGEKFGDEVELSEENSWKHVWENLPKNNDGEEIEYTIQEVGTVEGYTSSNQVNGDKTTITNTHTPNKPAIDLALRKFISAVGNKQYNREPKVDFSQLIPNGKEKTAIYEHSKKPVDVKVGDIVTYTIRVYNEGEANAYVGKVSDYLPEELTFINELNATDPEIKAATDFNAGYGWTIDTQTGEIYTEILSKNTKDTALQKIICNDQNRQSAMLNAFDGVKLDYIDLKVRCKVNEKAKSKEKITNVAEITEYENDEGEKVEKDRDSEPKNFPDENKNNDYEGNGNEGNYWPGKQDDDDFERLIIQQFDLSLRKFISDIDGKETTLREPVVDVTKLKDATNTTAEYNHTKQPITVVKGSVITYTIRVYNEGDLDGYVNEITDYLPPELEYIEDSQINEQYKWKLAKDGRTVTTDYLKYEYGKTDNLLKAYDLGDKLDYREVKIQCRVKDNAPYQKNITNLAQITEDCDAYGKDIDDRDSIPNDKFELPEDKDLPKYKDDELEKSYIPGQEDDDDFEKVNVVYFDLSLRKIVSKAIVTEDGETKVTETNHKFEDDPEEIVKVDIGRKKVNKVTVKFEYKIRVKNEGLIDGYAKEVKDYIPQGLEFNAQDNPQWKEISEGVITTDQLKDTLLKPGESKELTVLLTWKNSDDNLDLKVNTAEISKDYNEYNTPDIDSTPDNKKDGEDDIDDAPVMLSITPGKAKTYLGLTTLMLATTAVGIYLIKKYVI